MCPPPSIMPSASTQQKKEVKVLQVNIYKDRLQQARLFGTTVLYSVQPIPREDVPEGWYCYDLRGIGRQPNEPYALVDRAEDCHAGSVLSYLPLKSGRSREKLVRDRLTTLNPRPWATASTAQPAGPRPKKSKISTATFPSELENGGLESRCQRPRDWCWGA